MANAFEARLTPIPGLIVFSVPVHSDARGWFKENWQHEKMSQLGLSNFEPVQNNVSFNRRAGTIRGLHAEPWDKLVSVAHGRVFGAWVDLREGPSYGKTFTCEIDPSICVYVPEGVANGFQTLEDSTSYSYLVNAHWSPAAQYKMVNFGDRDLDIRWPLAVDENIVSEKDIDHPEFAQIAPIPAKPLLVFGGSGQLARAYKESALKCEFLGRGEIDFEVSDPFSKLDFRKYAGVINAVAFTKVDEAESTDGRHSAWRTNVTALSNLVRAMRRSGVPLIHFSSDYVFDGRKESAYLETDPLSPLGVYGQTKAAGDEVVATYDRHYILRTSWVVGDGRNFVRVMAGRAKEKLASSVVADQTGRLTFTDELVRLVEHIIQTQPPHGTYNVSNNGNSSSWYELARLIYTFYEVAEDLVTPVSSDEYAAGKNLAPRPRNSLLDLSKINSIGFDTRDWHSRLEEYLGELPS
jgi:dTDP-4-dehydrorhamnose 3,5-epimerase/reductase